MKSKTRVRIIFLSVAAAIIAAMLLIVCFWGLNGSVSGKTIGIILTGSKDETGWNTSHFNGADIACREYNAKLIVKENVLEDTGRCSAAIDELVSEGAELIILSSSGYVFECENTIRRYPNIHFFSTSYNSKLESVTPFFARMYQARYISGVIAAAQSTANSLGYVAAEHTSEVIRGIDAFALGARSYNPEISINVIFTDEWDNKEKECTAANRLVSEYGCDVIAYHQNLPNAAAEADRLGVYSIGYHERADGLSDRYLTSVVWNWQTIYHEIIKDYVQGEGAKKKRYWLGLDSDAARLTEYSPLVSAEARAAAAEAEQRIKSGKDVFSGLIYDNSGAVRCGEDEAISDDILFSDIDWFVQGVTVYD